MRNVIVLLQLLGLFLVWTVFTALLVPCAVAVWVLKQIISALNWVRERTAQ
ncbi:hypothetical protein MNJPNG_04915 [Cupriavidus oxalaticus]|uniref:hypothetical protein n=1 Tax=Cupriavidus oxalaticus TaxID=96344 RepID=UPI003F7349E9